MGKSFMEFRGRGFWVRDAPLELCLRLVTLNLRPRVWIDPSHFRELRETWLDATSGCQGCVGNCAKLDAVLRDDAMIQVSVEAARDVVAALRRIGPTLDPRYLNCLGLPGSFMADVETWKIEQVAEHFIGLLSGELEWDARASPLLPTADLRKA